MVFDDVVVVAVVVVAVFGWLRSLFYANKIKYVYNYTVRIIAVLSDLQKLGKQNRNI